MPGLDKSVQDAGALRRPSTTLPDEAEAVLVGRITFAEPGAEQLLQARKAVEAELLRKTYQRRGLHRGGCGDDSSGGEGHLFGIVEGVGRDLRQALGQRRLASEDRRAKGVKIAGRQLGGVAQGMSSCSRYAAARRHSARVFRPSQVRNFHFTNGNELLAARQ